MAIRIEYPTIYCIIPPVTLFPHAPLGVLGALSSVPSQNTLDWVALLMLGLFLGILLVSGASYYMTRRQIAQMKHDKVLSQPPLKELIPSSLDLPEQ